MSDLAAGIGLAFAPQWNEETDPVNLDKRFLGIDTDDRITERELLDMQYAQWADTALGRAIIDDLKLRIFYRPGFNAELGLLNGIAAGFERTGQENFLKYILASIERGRAARAKRQSK
jgi:hypothetical protein